MPVFDWSNDELRKSFEKDLLIHRNLKKDLTFCEKIRWFTGVIGIQAFLVICFYGTACYQIINDAKNEKIEKEAKMKAVCFIRPIYSA